MKRGGGCQRADAGRGMMGYAHGGPRGRAGAKGEEEMKREPIRIANKHSGSLIVDVDVQPGGKIEIVDGCLPVGETVSVAVNYKIGMPKREDGYDILSEPVPPGGFKSAEEVDAYIREIRGK